MGMIDESKSVRNPLLKQSEGHMGVPYTILFFLLFFFKSFSHLGCYIILSSVPCAVQ